MGKYLEALKILYGEDEKIQKPPEVEPAKPPKPPFAVFAGSRLEHFQENLSEPEPIPFTDHEIAEHKISQLKLHDDKVFVRRKLVGVYGAARLEVVEKYLFEWQQGVDTEPAEVKKENVGRYRANTWIREANFNLLTTEDICND
jgi:hypothetical protein